MLNAGKLIQGYINISDPIDFVSQMETPEEAKEKLILPATDGLSF
jgi:hypothetical protein